MNAEQHRVARRGFATLPSGSNVRLPDGGYRYWEYGDFGINPEHPPFAKLVDTLPLVFDGPRNPGPQCES